MATDGNNSIDDDDDDDIIIWDGGADCADRREILRKDDSPKR